MYNRCLVILSALLFASNNISFSTDGDIDFNIDFFPQNMKQEKTKQSTEVNTMKENVGQSGEDNDSIDFNFDLFPKKVVKEETNQYSNVGKSLCIGNITNCNNIALDNIIRGNINQIPVDIRNLREIKINEMDLQKNVQQYTSQMSDNEKQEILNNIFKNDTKQIMQDNNNIKSDNSIGNSKFKNLFDSIKASNQNNSQQFYCNNIKNLFNDTKIKNSNPFILSNNTSQQLQCNNTKNFLNKNIQYNNKFTLSNNLMGYKNEVNSGINTKSLQQNNKLFFIPNMKQQYYQYNYQYNIPFYKINYSSQNITNNYVKNNPINSQKDNEKSEIVNNRNNHNAGENINSRSMNSKDSKISNDKNRTNKNNK